MELEQKKKIDKQLRNRHFTYLEDPGHGWLIVTFDELDFFGLADEISAYSFQNGSLVYLEEDMDATTFAKAFKNRFGFFEYTSNYKETAHCRSYSSYDSKKAREANENITTLTEKELN